MNSGRITEEENSGIELDGLGCGSGVTLDGLDCGSGVILDGLGCGSGVALDSDSGGSTFSKIRACSKMVKFTS